MAELTDIRETVRAERYCRTRRAGGGGRRDYEPRRRPLEVRGGLLRLRWSTAAARPTRPACSAPASTTTLPARACPTRPLAPRWAAVCRPRSPTCRDGETVLDLGSGAGADVLISARRVAPTGKAIGLDMTDEMLELARANAAEAGVENVEFVKGYLEDMPLDDAQRRRRDLELRDQPVGRQAAGACARPLACCGLEDGSRCPT